MGALEGSNGTSHKIVVVDDDADLAELISVILRRVGFRVITTQQAPVALQLLARERPDLMTLDVDIGAWNGFDLLRQVRDVSQVPIMMISARDTEDDKVRAFELGADDYVTKPFGHRELVARITANLRRARSGARPDLMRLAVGRLALNEAEFVITKDGRPLELTVTEFKLLQYFMLHTNEALSTGDLLRHVWGFDDPGAGNVVRTTIHRLRQKLEDDPAHPQLLRTVLGAGFLLATERATAVA